MKEFDKIIGYEPVKKELIRICDILKNSEKYEKFGVKASQGLLLYGEPGVGKSLMADCFIKATGRKFFVCRKTKDNGDFVNEITKTFEEAKANAPSVILFDDIDKFANEDENHRDASEYVAVQSGIDSLVDYDVFVVATSNTFYRLPNSLTRAGRFTKILEIRPPEGKDAEEIIKYYLRQKENVGDIDYNLICRLLCSKTCADLETIVNEAGVYAVFEGKEKIDNDDMLRACLRVLYDAPETDDELFCMSNKMRKMTAYHEAGHAVVAELLEPESVTLVSIANYDGVTAGISSIYQPDDAFASINGMKNRLKSTLGGRASTELVFGEIDVGATRDLHAAYNLMVRFNDKYCQCGFDSSVRYFDNGVSDFQKERFNNSVSYELDKMYMEVKEMLAKNREFLDKFADLLFEKITVTMKDIKELKKSCKIVK